jgi:integrase
MGATQTRRRQHLQRRGGTWYYRRRLPASLAEATGRREVCRSLETSSYRHACEAAAFLDAKVERLRRAVRRVVELASEEEIRRVCDRFYAEIRAEDRQNRSEWTAPTDRGLPFHYELAEHIGMLGDFALDETERMAAGDRSKVIDDARRLAAESGISAEGSELDRLAFELQRTLVRAWLDCKAEWQADYSGRPRPPEAALGVATPAVPQSRGRLLSEGIELYLGVHGGQWAKKTTDETARFLNWFLQLVGDKGVREISREDVRAFEDALAKLPGNLPKGTRLREVLASDPASGLAAGTRAKCIGRIRSLLNFLEAEGWINATPAKGRPRHGKRGEQEGRYEPFSDDDLAAIFTAEFRRSTLDATQPARYWLPLTALYSGARRGEVAQLHVGDVRQIDGIWVLDLTARREGQSVKTESSRRIVPVHSQLVALGLIEYTQRRGGAGTGLLFPEVELNANGWGDAEGKWFGRWLRTQARISDSRKVFHSFRHTVVHRLKSTGTPEYLIARVVGHANASMTTGRYGGELSARDMVPIVERLDFREQLRGLAPAQGEG